MKIPEAAGPITKRSASRACALGIRLSDERPHYRSREDSARLDKGTGKIKKNSAEVRAGTCQIQVPAPPPSPKVSSHL
ncbi:unnamed protein product [Staurois parvus]|uniref:Uncharacterized protein n=1 Tax=Staurois parvus TaxID=386267 RepID=A0ABN9FVU2_9NEOB|nr:unnamed protein product [Staurois parvus]